MQQMKNRFGGETAKYIRIVLLVIYDILAIFLAEILSIWTRFDFSLKSEQGIPFLETALQYFWVNMIVTIVIFFIMHLYNSLWEYASVQELLNVVIACLLSAAIQSLGMHMFQWNMPRSYYILYFFFLLALVSGSRFVYRGLRIIRHSYLGDASRHAIATMVIGAGDSANFLIKNMENSPLIRNRVVCVIDADKNKIGSTILELRLWEMTARFHGQQKNTKCRKFLLLSRICREIERKRFWNCVKTRDVKLKFCLVWRRL